MPSFFLFVLVVLVISVEVYPGGVKNAEKVIFLEIPKLGVVFLCKDRKFQKIMAVNIRRVFFSCTPENTDDVAVQKVTLNALLIPNLLIT